MVDLTGYNAAGWRTRTQNQYDPAKPRALYTYGYDKAGQQRTQQINGSSAYAVTTTLDAEGLARAMTETLVPTSPATATWSYYPTDQLRSSAVGTALTTTQFYDGNSRLAHWEARSTSGATTPLSRSVDYGHLPTGWTSAVTSTSGAGAPSVQAYSHDPQGRLTSTQGPGSATASWSYDKDGNILQAVSSGGVTTTYGYTGTSGVAVPTAWKPGELLWTQAGSAPPTVYGYDGSGHTTAISTTSGYSLTLGYDPQGRLGGVHALQGPVQVTQTQSYNASGLRSGYAVTRTGTAPLTLSEAFIYRAGQVGSLVSISNSVVTTDTFVYDQRGLPLALIHSPAGGTPARYWYVLDGHATVVALTDSAGNVVDSYSYDAWGKPLSVNEQVTQPYRYASYWYDTELGWYWLSSRHYSPSLQRFLQPDPSSIDGTLSYVYVGDDPIDAYDSFGWGCTPFDGWFVFGGLACGVGATASGLGSLAHGGYDIVAGDDITAILKDPNPLAKVVAVVDLGSNAVVLIPFAGEVFEAAHLAAKAGLVGRKVAIRLLSKDDVRQLLKKAGRRLTGDVKAACHCFPAATLVVTPAGLQAISTLRVGDTVLAEDPQRGVVERDTVQALIADPAAPLLSLELSDGSTITVTADHPFWVDLVPGLTAGGWLEAGKLRAGDHLRTASGTSVAVTAVRRGVGHAVVYNLSVVHDHTFFIGAAQVLVHNCIDDKFYAQLERQLAASGPKSILKSLRSLEGRLAEHEAKVGELDFKSSVEREIRTFTRQIATLKQFIRDRGIT